jgi:hypothetical protein
MLHFGSRSLRINRRNFGTGRPPENTNRIAQETGAEKRGGEMCKGTPFTIPCGYATDAPQLCPRRVNSAREIENPEKPQSRQAVIFGNAKTLGLSRLLRPER